MLWLATSPSAAGRCPSSRRGDGGQAVPLVVAVVVVAAWRWSPSGGWPSVPSTRRRARTAADAAALAGAADGQAAADAAAGRQRRRPDRLRHERVTTCWSRCASGDAAARARATMVLARAATVSDGAAPREGRDRYARCVPPGDPSGPEPAEPKRAGPGHADAQRRPHASARSRCPTPTAASRATASMTAMASQCLAGRPRPLAGVADGPAARRSAGQRPWQETLTEPPVAEAMAVAAASAQRDRGAARGRSAAEVDRPPCRPSRSRSWWLPTGAGRRHRRADPTPPAPPAGPPGAAAPAPPAPGPQGHPHRAPGRRLGRLQDLARSST